VTTTSTSAHAATPANAVSFFSTPVQVTVASGQYVWMYATTVLSSNTNDAPLVLEFCYATSATGTPQPLGSSNTSPVITNSQVRPTLQMWSLAGNLTGLSALNGGSPFIGLCGSSTAAGDWNTQASTTSAYTTAIVHE
jgi:hypothetical protein